MPQSIQAAHTTFPRETWALTVSEAPAAAAALLAVSGSYFPFKGHRQQNHTGGNTDRLQIWSSLVWDF